MTTLPTHFGPVAAEPYPWPYNGSFAPATTALIIPNYLDDLS